MAAYRNPNSSRQRIWTALRGGKWISEPKLALKAKANERTTTGYINKLVALGYAEKSAHGVRLVKNTGPIAVSIGHNGQAVRDWNLDPPMHADELRAIWKSSSLSMRRFALALGFHGASSGRMKQMIDGARIVSDQVAEAARAYRRAFQK